MTATARAEIRQTALVPALAGSLGVFVAATALSWHNAGVFEYPLDDVYIHLAMAEQIVAGGYGVNAGEYASASSSPLYSLLLVPLSGTELHRYLPLAWNALAITVSGLAWAGILARATESRPLPRLLTILLAFAVPVLLHLAIIAAIGMEHGLHAAISLLLLLGLIDLLHDGHLSAPLVAAIVIGPLLRFEGLALSLLACGAIILSGRFRAGVLLSFAAIVPLALFAYFLTRLGLDPLPSSVLVKLDTGAADTGTVAKLLARLTHNLATPPGLAIALLAAVSLLLGLLNGTRASIALALIAAAAAAAHLAFGRIGWMDRYENYILAFTGTAALYLGLSGRIRTLGPVLTLVALLLMGANLYRYAAGYLTWNQYAASSVHLQHAQMARFAQDHAQVPVAVNDLGRVAYGNPNYVLDLWGLASQQAREIRLSPDRHPGWAAPLAEAHDVRLAMIYDRYLADAIGPDWIRLGQLDHLANRGMLADRSVAFYATHPEDVPALRAALDDFVPTLPGGVRFTFADPASTTETDDADN